MGSRSDERSFWTAAAVVALVLWSTAAPTPLYPEYAARWDLDARDLTLLYAAHNVALVVGFVTFGNISDYVGRRPTIAAGLLLATSGACTYALADDVALVYAGRVLCALGVALALGPATAVMAATSRTGGERAAAASTVATSTGLVVALLLGGAVVDSRPDPAYPTFLPLVALLALVLAASWTITGGEVRRAGVRWRPRTLDVSPGLVGPLLLGACIVGAAFFVGGLVLSLGSTIAADVLGPSRALVGSLVLSASACAMAAGGLVGARWTTRRALWAGGISGPLSLAAMASATTAGSILVLVVAFVAAGLAYGFLYSAGLSVVARSTVGHDAGAAFSFLFLVACASQGVLVVAFGAGAVAWGMVTALAVAAVSMAATCLVIGCVRRPPTAG